MKNIKKIITYKTILAAFIYLITISSIKAQDFLLLENVFPTSYKFTAGLLKNGHFFINTKYAADTSNQLIYREENTGLKPINYTSFVHFKIDNYVFQLPFENNSVTQLPPPQYPLIVSGLFRDTLLKTPRINASLLAVMPDNKDSVWFTFTMHPYKRGNGGFIRFIARIDSSRLPHNIGVLLLVDTKIATNDRAPIITSYGYYKTERQFETGIAPGIPEFWLAIEGSPVNPGLTARGNLRATGLITPDLFMFGNWSDYTANTFIKGLSSFLWKDRKAEDTLAYFDSSVLLIWNEKNVPIQRNKREIASTEIGILDSLQIVDAGGTYGGGGGGGGGMGDGLYYARVNGCITLDTVRQLKCQDPDYYPYNPDTLQAVLIITNTKNKTFSNLRIQVAALPPGIESVKASSPFIPNQLLLDETGIGLITLIAKPRLKPYIYYVPFAIMGNANDTLGIDSLCIIVPGIQIRDSLVDLAFRLTCPSTADTAVTQAFLLGIRCREIDTVYIIGTPPDINCFRIISTKSNLIAPDNPENITLEFKPSSLGAFNAKLVFVVKDWDDFPGGDTVYIADTCDLSGMGKDEEFLLASAKDTLDFGKICVGDTALFEWPILNLGGCDVIIQSAQLLNNRYGAFSLANSVNFPMTIPKQDVGSIGKATINFHPKQGGWDTVRLIISSNSFPRSDTLVIVGYGDIPSYLVKNPIIHADTICPGEKADYSFLLDNSTACPVQIDSVWIVTNNTSSAQITPEKFTITQGGDVDINISLNSLNVGIITSKVFIKSYGKTDSSVTFTVPVASRTADAGLALSYGDVRIGTKQRLSKTITSTGSAGIEISNIRIQGVHQSDFVIILPNGVTLPYYLAPGNQLTFDIEFAPSDIESRQAELIVDFTKKKICTALAPVNLNGRGIRPLLTIMQDKIDFGRVCIGSRLDTFIIIRNTGNGPLYLFNIKPLSGSDFTISGNMPMRIDTSQNAQINLSFQPSLIGPLNTSFTFSTDADWMFPQDTVYDLTGTGILCGEIAVDTINATVGSKIQVPVRIISSTNVPSSDFAQIMNNSGFNDVSISIGNNRRLFRFDGVNNGNGMLGTTALFAYSPDSVSISKNPLETLISNQVLASPSGEVLLGDDYTMPLELKINSFASGYHNLIARNGLLNLGYCALDKRFIRFDTSKAFVSYITKENASIIINIIIQKSSDILLKTYNILGQEQMIIHDGILNTGAYKFILDEGLINGLNIIVLKSGTEVKSFQVIK